MESGIHILIIKKPPKQKDMHTPNCQIEQHRLGSHEKQPLLFSLVHLFLCLVSQKGRLGMKNFTFCLIIGIFLIGCATSGKISALKLGMTKDNVLAVMGDPVSISAQGNAEYLNYALSENSDDAFMGITRPYYVRLVNGRVESFGRTGDFDSTKKPTVRIESDQTIKKDVQVEDSSDFYTEFKKLQELKESGAITEDEYQALKKKLLEKY